MANVARELAKTLGCLAASLAIAAPPLAAATFAEPALADPAPTKNGADTAPLKPAPYPPPGALVRPPPFKEDIETPALPRTRHVALSIGVTTMSRPAADTLAFGAPARTTYSPTLGLLFAIRYPIFKYLEVASFLEGGQHHIGFSKGALGINGTIKSDSLTTIWFGAKALPTLPIGDRVRLFGALGVGWGRFEFPQMTAQEPGRLPFIIKGRGSSFVTFPLGVGSSIEIIKNWLAVDFELDWSPNIHKDGTSFVVVQALDNGHERDIGPMPIVHLTYTQSLALTLLL